MFRYHPLGLTDWNLIQKIGRATYEPYYPHIWKPGGLDWYMEYCFGREQLQEELQDPNIQYWLAEEESGAPVGFLKIVLQKPSPDFSPQHPPVENALYLEKIYLMPDFFGKGAGQYLIQFVKDIALQWGRQLVWLQVMEHGPIQAYARAGFKMVGAVRWEFEFLKEEERGGWVMVFPIQ